MSESDSARERSEAAPVANRLLALPEQTRLTELQALQRDDPGLHDHVLTLIQATVQASAPRLVDTVPPSGADSDLQPGSVLGPYRIDRRIGRGGMGEVWLAQRSDGLYQGQVAIKTLYAHLARPGIRERFTREGQILAKLTHPHIARLLDAGVAGSLMYLVLEYVRGQRIDLWCEDRQLDVAARLRLFLDVCDAVAHAHAHLVVHRDIKPPNILVDEEGRVKLLDFGIAKLLEGGDEDSGEETELTRLGGRLLTPEYAAPEQLLGGAITTVTDVYALGVLLYQLLSGNRPYGNLTGTVQIEQAVLNTDPRPPSHTARTRESGSGDKTAAGSTERLARTLHGDLDNICLMALKKRPDQRYPSVLALRNDIHRYLDNEPVTARGAPFGYRASKFVRRHRLGVSVAATGAVLGAMGVAGILWQAHLATLAGEAEHQQRQLVEAREAELKQVVDFQGAMLKRVDVQKMGAGWLERTRSHIADHLQQDKTTPAADAERTLADFDRMRPWSQPTEVARESLGAYVLAPAEAEIAQRFAAQPLRQDALRTAVADTYLGLGLLPEAKAELNRALAAMPGMPDAPEVLAAQLKLAEVQNAAGDPAAAVATAQKVVEARQRLLGPTAQDTLAAQAELVDAMNIHGDYDAALAIGLPLLQQQEKLLGPDHADTLQTALTLGATYDNKADNAKARVLYERVYEARRRLLGDDDPATLKAGMTYAGILESMNDNATARDLYRKLVEDCRRVLGEEHPTTINALLNLSLAVDNLGDKAESYKLKEQTYRLAQHALGEENRISLVSASNFAVALDEHGQQAEALEIFRHVAALRTRLLGPDNPSTLRTLSNVASLLVDEKHYAEARPMLEDVLARQRRVSGPEHPATLMTWKSLAACLELQGQAAAAEKNFRDMLVVVRKLAGDDDPDTLRVEGMLEQSIGDQRRYGEAEPLQRATLAAERKAMGDTHPDTLATESQLASTLYHLHRYREAQPLARHAADELRKQFGNDPSNVKDAAQTLASIDRALAHSAAAVATPP